MIEYLHKGLALLNRAGTAIIWQRGAVGAAIMMEHEHAVMRGEISGSAPFSSSGVREVATSDTGTPVTPNGLANVPPAAGVQMTFASTSVEDSANGTGIRSIVVGYIEATTLLPKTETITLNGQAGVVSTVLNNAFINTLTMQSAGSAGKAVGNITATSGGVVYGIIKAGSEIQESAYRCVPASKTFFPRLILASSISSTAGTESLFRIVTRLPGSSYFLPSSAMGVQNGSLVIPLYGRGLPAGTIFGITNTTDKAAIVTAGIVGFYEDTPQ